MVVRMHAVLAVPAPGPQRERVSVHTPAHQSTDCRPNTAVTEAHRPERDTSLGRSLLDHDGRCNAVHHRAMLVVAEQHDERSETDKQADKPTDDRHKCHQAIQ